MLRVQQPHVDGSYLVEPHKLKKKLATEVTLWKVYIQKKKNPWTIYKKNNAIF